MVDVSVVVPCFDEGEVVGALHAAVVAALEPTGAVFEICYVDDGSRDGTVERLRELARADARVRYTSFSRNFGKESALLAGMRMSRGAAVVLMDADLQHPPELLPRMLELRRHGYDQVVARRDRSGENPVRRALSRAYYRLVRRFMEVEVVDGAGDFRLLSRRAVAAVLSLPESNRFSKGLFSWIGFDTVCFRYENAPGPRVPRSGAAGGCWTTASTDSCPSTAARCGWPCTPGRGCSSRRSPTRCGSWRTPCWTASTHRGTRR
ncbi:glycosyltransferase family 2 protein [Streptomyces somaliensis]|uniref:glycosyltransferase family 2 protein n=1 Tax=Streptomyces somaliensis TaxID=78355 RepID=UPI0034E93D5F|nr:glycosyltransferase family 2 protein [Streptomyces somaliensis]